MEIILCLFQIYYNKLMRFSNSFCLFYMIDLCKITKINMKNELKRSMIGNKDKFNFIIHRSL